MRGSEEGNEMPDKPYETSTHPEPCEPGKSTGPDRSSGPGKLAEPREPDKSAERPEEQQSKTGAQIGIVIKLDRGYPLVYASNGERYRCEHAMGLVKNKNHRAVIGDKVKLSIPETHDKAVIEEILPRKNELIRKDPTERELPQVLAANFDRIFVAQPLSEINIRRLERELVVAHETGVPVTVLLTKADLAAHDDSLSEQVEYVQSIVGDDEVLVISTEDTASIEAVRALVPKGTTSVLMGKSGVGKSSLVNLLVGEEIQETASVRQTDGKGRHTTVSREIVSIPGGGYIVDMPGVRGLGLWEAEAGVEAAFSDIEELSSECKFRDCKHENEPGCAVLAAVDVGSLTKARLDSYRALRKELEDTQARQEEAERLRTRTGHPRRRSKR